MKKSFMLLSLCLALVICLMTACGGSDKNPEKETSKKDDYAAAVEFVDNGDYQSAGELFKKLGDYEDSKTRLEECRANLLGGREVLDEINSYNVGDVITLGSCEQSLDNEELEPMEWLVVDKAENKVLVVSTKVLEAMQYADSGNKTWDTSVLREWLNKDFYKLCFTEKERNKMINSKLEPVVENAELKSTAKPTEDHIFVLSSVEAEKYFPATEAESQEGKIVESRRAVPTEYAINKGVYTVESGHCWWWLRDASPKENFGAVVRTTGVISKKDNDVDVTKGGVRPAMWLGVDF